MGVKKLDMNRYIAVFLSFFCLMPLGLDAQNTLASAREKVFAYNRDCKFLNFSFITDVHAAGKSRDMRFAQKNLEDFVSLSNEGFCDFAAFGGDAYSAYDARFGEALGFISVAKKHFDRLRIPFYPTKGNHDRNGKVNQDETISAVQYHMLYLNHLEKDGNVHFNPEDPYGNYYYVDFPREKVRAVFLNYYDAETMQDAGIHRKQLKWLRESALAPEGNDWTLIFFSHNYTQLSQAFWAMLTQFRREDRGKIAALIFGDTHKDLYNNDHGINCVGVACGYCGREALGTPAENTFSIFTLDTETNTLKETRVGPAKDRSFRYAD